MFYSIYQRAPLVLADLRLALARSQGQALIEYALIISLILSAPWPSTWMACPLPLAQAQPKASSAFSRSLLIKIASEV